MSSFPFLSAYEKNFLSVGKLWAIIFTIELASVILKFFIGKYFIVR